MVLSILNTDPSRRDTENLSPHKLLASPPKPKIPNGRARAHNIPGGIKYLLSDPKRRRRVSARSAALLFPRSTSRPTRSRGKCVDAPKIHHTPPPTTTPTRDTQIQSSVPISVTFPSRLPDLPHKQISAEVLASLGFTPQVPTQYIRDQMDQLSPRYGLVSSAYCFCLSNIFFVVCIRLCGRPMRLLLVQHFPRHFLSASMIPRLCSPHIWPPFTRLLLLPLSRGV
jgi:hypothetical protein